MSGMTPIPMAYGKRPDDLEVLAKSALLSRLSPRELGTFLDTLDQVALPAGTAVFREGEEGEYMYFVLEGRAHIRRGQLELRPVGPGDHFGELALISGKPRAATVEAHTVMRLARLSRGSYRSLHANHPKVALAFVEALAAAVGDALIAMTDGVGLLVRQRSMPRRTQVKVRRDGESVEVGTGTLTGTMLPRSTDGVVVGATLDMKAVSLDTAIVSDASLAPLTLATAEGRAVLRRGAALAVLEAARRTHASARVRMGPPLETGQVVLVEGEADLEALRVAMTSELKTLVRTRVPLVDEIWALDEATAFLSESGWTDAAALLPSRRGATVTLVRCGETFALGMGPVVPTAELLGEVSLLPHPRGMLVSLGPSAAAFMPALGGAVVDPLATEAAHPRHESPMAVEQRRWARTMGVSAVGSFGQYCVAGQVADLIRVAEGFHEKWIGRIADEIATRRDQIRAIVIAGPSASGKTTFIRRLTVQHVVNGMRPVNVSLDDYYVDRERTVRDEKGEYDFEALEAIDLPLLHADVARLLTGETVRTARYDFIEGKSHPGGGKARTLARGDMLLLEGIHGLNPALLGDTLPPESVFRVFVHPATTLPFDHLNVLAPEDVRLLRRLVRDRHHRNYTAADTILRWPSVRSGELRHIYPWLPHADAVFDSSLVYELSVLKIYAERYLLEVPSSHAAYTTAHRLRELIDQFVAIRGDHVPPTSVLREFIGESGFEY